LVDRAKGYGMEGIKTDGNNIEVYHTIKRFSRRFAPKTTTVLIEKDF
jgi:TPP-dependent pyruvate/acetoin dehydrogenase alpha subunit